MQGSLKQLVAQISPLTNWLESLETNRSLSKILTSMIYCSEKGGTIFVAGNGGSAAEASHFVSELVGAGIRCIGLSSDLAVITALSNDFCYDNVFANQLEALGEEGDIFLALTTRGSSINILRGLSKARSKRVERIVLSGARGTQVNNLSNHLIIVPSDNVQRIQEIHLMILHWFYQGLGVWKKGKVSDLAAGHTNAFCLSPLGCPCLCTV